MVVLVHVYWVRMYSPTKKFEDISLVRLIPKRQLILEMVRKESEKAEADYQPRAKLGGHLDGRWG
jgi:hypothetical protein